MPEVVVAHDFRGKDLRERDIRGARVQPRSTGERISDYNEPRFKGRLAAWRHAQSAARNLKEVMISVKDGEHFTLWTLVVPQVFDFFDKRPKKRPKSLQFSSF